MLYAEKTGKIIEAFYKVYNALGYGFLEKVYENALIIELKKTGFASIPQQRIKVFYEGQVIGEYFADIVVDDLIVLEQKAAEKIAQDHKTQLLNYLKATDKEVGLLLNFGKKPEFARVIFTNDRKRINQSLDNTD
ncbi:MAG: GxxExxY protein [Phycisphaerae bacterium SM23_30]|nr:MAG: GxxExxY protein [Phycisphaerae bacterium SM23_30]